MATFSRLLDTMTAEQRRELVQAALAGMSDTDALDTLIDYVTGANLLDLLVLKLDMEAPSDELEASRLDEIEHAGRFGL